MKEKTKKTALAVGARIRALRKAASLTQRALSEESGLAESAIARWELGHFTPDAVSLMHLSAGLGCTVNDILSDGQGAMLVRTCEHCKGTGAIVSSVHAEEA